MIQTLTRLAAAIVMIVGVFTSSVMADEAKKPAADSGKWLFSTQAAIEINLLEQMAITELAEENMTSTGYGFDSMFRREAAMSDSLGFTVGLGLGYSFSPWGTIASYTSNDFDLDAKITQSHRILVMGSLGVVLKGILKGLAVTMEMGAGHKWATLTTVYTEHRTGDGSAIASSLTGKGFAAKFGGAVQVGLMELGSATLALKYGMYYAFGAKVKFEDPKDNMAQHQNAINMRLSVGLEL